MVLNDVFKTNHKFNTYSLVLEICLRYKQHVVTNQQIQK